MKLKKTKKIITKENSKSSLSLENSTLNKKNDSNKKSKKSIFEHKSTKFPKNVNDYKHIIDDLSSGVSNIEYILQLRRNKDIQNISKEITGNSPSFYDTDSKKYKTRYSKKLDEKEFLKTNLGTFGYILSDKTKYAINETQYKFETTLRTNSFNTQRFSRNYSHKMPLRWDNTIIPRSRNLFNNILPPVLDRSKEIFNKYGKQIGRPIITIYKDGYINGKKIKSRIFDYNKNIALRYPSEHYPSSKYKNEYGIQNINSIRHLLDYDNKTMTSFWSTNLRDIKKVKYSIDEIKKREKRLRDNISQKVYPKNS
jgi:hypothetical protein